MQEYVALLNEFGPWAFAGILLWERINITPKFTDALNKISIVIDERLPKKSGG